MNIEEIKKKIGEKFHSSQKEDNISDELVQKVIKPIQDEEQEVSDEQISEQILELLKQYKDSEQRKEFLKKLNEAEEIPSSILVNSAVKIADSEEVPDSLAVELATQLPDKPAVNILENADITSGQDRLAIINSLNDDKVKEEQVCTELQNFYSEYKEVMPAPQFVDKIRDILGVCEQTETIKEALYRVIAKNFALSYYNFNRAMKTYDVEKIVPAEKMIRIKMPKRIEDEYNQLLTKNDEYDYDLEGVTEVFLDDVIKKSVEQAKKTNEEVTSFIPNLGVLNDREIEYIAERAEYYDKRVNGLEKESIKAKLSGKEDNKTIEVEGLVDAIEDLPPKQAQIYMRSLANLTPRDMDTLMQCINGGLIKKLSAYDNSSRKKYIEATIGFIEQKTKSRTKNSKDGESINKDEEDFIL